MDSTTFERRQERQEHTALAALQSVLRWRILPDFVLFLEDDLVFNRNMVRNLENWAPLRSRNVTLASLYNPTVIQQMTCKEEHWFIARPEDVYGSQAFVLSPELVFYCVAHWWDVPGMQDIKISRLAGRLGRPIFYHTPSLVQHRSVPSVWGGHIHYAKDFAPE
jgi:hypothetical protein